MKKSIVAVVTTLVAVSFATVVCAADPPKPIAIADPSAASATAEENVKADAKLAKAKEKAEAKKAKAKVKADAKEAKAKVKAAKEKSAADEKAAKESVPVK
jgi:Skp family chaperone for outer membrane proteins